jgi:hypothetical protein
MDAVLERIAAWEADGLIDAATAMRLRVNETGRPDAAEVTTDETPPVARRGPSSLAQIFGPGVAIGEVFAYLGGAFLLGAYNGFLVRMTGSGSGSRELTLAVGFALAALALTGIGVFLRTGDARRGRAAGVVFAVAVGHAAAAGAALAATYDLQFQLASLVAALVATAVAVGLRGLHPSVMTQFSLLASLTGLGGAILAWVEWMVVPEPVYGEFGVDVTGRPDPIILLIVAAAWWLGVALLLGLLALVEARRGDDDPSAARRAGLTRLWAGFVAVVGLASAVMRSDYVASPIGDYGRVLEPWIGDAALLVLAAILVERAFRRDANAYVFAAALAVVTALTDFNFTYLSSSTEVGLLIEGVILLGAGFAADRLRRRVGHSEPTDEPTMAPGASA